MENLSDLNRYSRLRIEEALGAIAHNYIQGTILSSSGGCAIFAIQHLNTMNRLLNEKDKNFYLKEGNATTADIDPIFLKHIQSMKGAEKYEITHQGEDLFIDKKHSKTFREHIDNFTVTVEVSDEAGNIALKKRNYSILYKTEKYLREALKTLEELHGRENGELEIERVLKNRTGHNVLNGLYKQMGLTLEQTQHVQELYNQDQINLALHYGISTDSLKTAKCFDTKGMSKAVFEFISHAPSQSTFDDVKNLSTLQQFYAVTQYGLSPQEVEKSSFLKNKNLAPGTFQYLQEWCDKAGEKGINAAFATIKIFESYKPKEDKALNTIDNLCNQDANRFLEFCIMGQNHNLIKLWLEAGADVNLPLNGTTPLAASLKTDNPEIITQIIVAGANIDLPTFQMAPKHFTLDKLMTYLKAAIDQESAPAINNLIQFFPDLLEIKIDGISPFEYAIRQNKTNILQPLFPEGKKITPSKMGIENMDLNSPRTTPTKRKAEGEAKETTPPKGMRLDL